MITKELLDFLSKEKATGRTNEEIKSVLVQNGWLTSDVEEGFQALEVPKPAPVPSPSSNPRSFVNPAASQVVTMPKRGHGGKRAMLFMLLLLLFAGSASAYFFRDTVKTWPVVREFFPNGEGAMVAPEMETTTDTNLNTNINTNNISGQVVAKGKVNLNEIGGNSLKVMSAFSDPSVVGIDGSFTNVRVSGDSPQLIIVMDDMEKLRAETISLPKNINNLIFDAASTATVSIILAYGGLGNLDLQQSEQGIDKLQTLKCFEKLKSFYQKNLLNSSLTDLAMNPYGEDGKIILGCKEEIPTPYD